MGTYTHDTWCGDIRMNGGRMKRFFMIVLALILGATIFAGSYIQGPIQIAEDLWSLSLITDDVSGDIADQEETVTVFAFTPGSNSLGDSCAIQIGYRNDDSVSFVNFEIPYETIFTTTTDDIFDGEFIKSINAIVSPESSNSLSISGVDYDYLVSILQRNRGTTRFYIEDFVIDFDYDPVEFSRKLESCRTSNEQALLNW